MAGSELVFVWSGSDRTGRSAQGEISAPSIAIAKAQLRRQGINAKRVKKKPAALFSFGNNITSTDIAIFTRQLATMTRAGVPMVQSMDIVMDGTDKPLMKDLVRQVRNDVSGAHPLLRDSRNTRSCSMNFIAASFRQARPQAPWRSCLIV